MKSKIADNLERSKALLAKMKSERRNTMDQESEVREILVILDNANGAHSDDKTGKSCADQRFSTPSKRATRLRVSVDGHHPIFVPADRLTRHPRESITVGVGPPIVQPEKK